MWRKGNPNAPLVGRQVGKAIIKATLAIPQKSKIRITI